MSAATPLDTRVETRLMKEVRRPSAQKSRGFPLAAIEAAGYGAVWAGQRS